jgi:hypothetical protein
MAISTSASRGWIGGIVGGLQRMHSVASSNGNRDTKIVPARGPVLSFAGITAQVDMCTVRSTIV